MKIAFIPSTFLPNIGGAEIQAHNLANSLIKEKNEVEIFLLNNVSIENANYKIVKLNKYFISFVFLMKYYFYLNFSFLLRLYFKNIIQKKKFDIWHFHSVNYKTLIYIDELKKLNQKVVVTLQGADIQSDKEIKYGYRLDKKYDVYLKKVFQNVDSFHAISSDISKELLDIGIKKDKIIIIPNCSPVEKIKSFNKKKNETLTLLTIGRYIVKKKGFDLVEKVARELENITNFKWIIIGRNTKELLKNKYIKDNLNRFEIVDQINNESETFFPSSDLIKFYKNSDVYVNLARVEGSPLVLIDAIASNIPIVTFNTRGGNELVLEGINGFIIDNFDYKLFAKKIHSSQNFLINENNHEVSNHINHFDLTENTKKIINCYNFLSQN